MERVAPWVVKSAQRREALERLRELVHLLPTLSLPETAAEAYGRIRADWKRRITLPFRTNSSFPGRLPKWIFDFPIHQASIAARDLIAADRPLAAAIRWDAFRTRLPGIHNAREGHSGRRLLSTNFYDISIWE